jgi:outer membrane lipoprotein-sorting protein
MHAARKLVVAVAITLLALAVRAAFAAPVASGDLEKERVLRRLDEAAKNFHSTSADFEFDVVERAPIAETDVQKGTIYFERKAGAFQMAARIRELNGKISEKVYSYTSGVFKFYEKLTNQVTRFKKASQFESYLMLGFGASGKDLEDKWEIKYLGPETLLDGKTSVKTEKLELVAKDPSARKYASKVTIWMDTARAVSLKQVIEEDPEHYRVCVYYNIQTNLTLPKDAFALDTNKQTQVVDR